MREYKGARITERTDISTHCCNVSGKGDQILVNYYTVKFSD